MPTLDLNGDRFHYHLDDFSDPWLRAEPVLLHHAAGGNLHRWRGWCRHWRGGIRCCGSTCEATGAPRLRRK